MKSLQNQAVSVGEQRLNEIDLASFDSTETAAPAPTVDTAMAEGATAARSGKLRSWQFNMSHIAYEDFSVHGDMRTQ